MEKPKKITAKSFKHSSGKLRRRIAGSRPLQVIKIGESKLTTTGNKLEEPTVTVMPI